MTSFVSTLLSHTPTGVWIGLGVLVAIGLAQTRDRDVSARRVWAMPLLLGAYSAWSVSNAFTGAGELPALAGWLAGAAIGWHANRALGLPRRVAAQPDGSYRIGGSFAPLLLFVGIFALRYAVAATLAMLPQLRGDPATALAASALIGWPAGLLAARSRRILASGGAAYRARAT